MVEARIYAGGSERKNGCTGKSLTGNNVPLLPSGWGPLCYMQLQQSSILWGGTKR